MPRTPLLHSSFLQHHIPHQLLLFPHASLFPLFPSFPSLALSACTTASSTPLFFPAALPRSRPTPPGTLAPSPARPPAPENSTSPLSPAISPGLPLRYSRLPRSLRCRRPAQTAPPSALPFRYIPGSLPLLRYISPPLLPPAPTAALRPVHKSPHSPADAPAALAPLPSLFFFPLPSLLLRFPPRSSALPPSSPSARSGSTPGILSPPSSSPATPGSSPLSSHHQPFPRQHPHSSSACSAIPSGATARSSDNPLPLPQVLLQLLRIQHPLAADHIQTSP